MDIFIVRFALSTCLRCRRSHTDNRSAHSILLAVLKNALVFDVFHVTSWH